MSKITNRRSLPFDKLRNRLSKGEPLHQGSFRGTIASNATMITAKASRIPEKEQRKEMASMLPHVFGKMFALAPEMRQLPASLPHNRSLTECCTKSFRLDSSILKAQY
ncbi:hypothetical protein [Fibrobacter sp. UWS1]|uniref:hypothetical protein n=1 Tax=Fibrobacter sp. UWS1 TaxID=1896220 RepID=UPI00117BCEB1|nr:hypothetical protein [Fibrobacter sp. UWS1]